MGAVVYGCKLIQLEGKNRMENPLRVGTAVVFSNAPDGQEKFAIITHVSGGDRKFRIITKEEAGANPIRLLRPPKT
jgi:hypothetical protein